jgi:hypothetical protein
VCCTARLPQSGGRQRRTATSGSFSPPAPCG